MWEDTQFEKAMKSSLSASGHVGDVLIANYITARKILVEQVYEEIRATEPELSDHGPRHIQNVLENVGHLIGKDKKYFNPWEHYFLGMVTLFHDVGNIQGRERHNERIKEVYVHTRGNTDRQEMRMILQAAKAHTGNASDGSKDTLKELEDGYYYQSQSVRLREIAAVLRMADELADGPQRTSRFVFETMGYAPESEIFHRYASCVEVTIDRNSGRFALSFNIDVCKAVNIEDKHINSTRNLLEFCYKRLVKLDQERKYTKFYCNLLAPFRLTSGKFLFWINDEERDFDLPTVLIDDRVVPGDATKTVTDLYPALDLQTIAATLAKIKNERAGGQTDDRK
jgi:hypothetical protein